MPGYTRHMIGRKRYYRELDYWETVEFPGSPGDYYVYANWNYNFTGSPLTFVPGYGGFTTTPSQGVTGYSGAGIYNLLDYGQIVNGELRSWSSSGGVSNCYASMCRSATAPTYKGLGRVSKIDGWYAEPYASGSWGGGRYVGSCFSSNVRPFDTAGDQRFIGWYGNHNINYLTRGNSNSQLVYSSVPCGSPTEGRITGFAVIQGGYGSPIRSGRYNANPDNTTSAGYRGGKQFVKFDGQWTLIGIDTAANISHTKSFASLTSVNVGSVPRRYDTYQDKMLTTLSTNFPEIHTNVGHVERLGPASTLSDRGWTVGGAGLTGSGDLVYASGGSPSWIIRDMGFSDGVALMTNGRGSLYGPALVFRWVSPLEFIGIRPYWGPGLYNDAYVFYRDGSPTIYTHGTLYDGGSIGEQEIHIEIRGTLLAASCALGGTGALTNIPAQFNNGSTKWGIWWEDSTANWCRHVDIQPCYHQNYNDILNRLT